MPILKLFCNKIIKNNKMANYKFNKYQEWCLSHSKSTYSFHHDMPTPPLDSPRMLSQTISSSKLFILYLQVNWTYTLLADSLSLYSISEFTCTGLRFLNIFSNNFPSNHIYSLSLPHPTSDSHFQATFSDSHFLSTIFHFSHLSFA